MVRRRSALPGLAVALHVVLADIPWLEEELRTQDESALPGMPCSAPVRRKPVVFPRSLLLGDAAKGLSMFSGYVNVTDRDFLFYWLFEAESGASADAPLVVWSNGGPGCSAMEGATTEHGPLVLYGIKEDGRLSSRKLSRNPYAWTRKAHVLYVDQPRYVGFSCGTGPFVTNSVDAGRDMVTFLRGWRGLFPEHAKRDVIFASESYGGHFVPAWSSAALDYNAAGPADPIRLVGLAIGNGIVDQSVQDKTFPEFARRHGLLPPNISVESSWGAREIMKNYLGYEPNYYDYRLVEQGCCGCSSYNYKPWSEFMAREDVQAALNVCGTAGTKAFGGCAAGCVQLPAFDEADNFSYTGALSRALEQGIHVSLYYGMQDTACNYVGGYAMASSLPWSGAAAFRAAPLEEFLVGGISTGSAKSSGGLTWFQIEGAGHMVPINNPAAALRALTVLLPNRSGSRRDGIFGAVVSEAAAGEAALAGPAGSSLPFGLISLAACAGLVPLLRRATRARRESAGGDADVPLQAPQPEEGLP